jgi:hypothetical protein
VAEAMTITPPVDSSNLKIQIPEFIDFNRLLKLAPFRDQVLSYDEDPTIEWNYYIEALYRYADHFGELNKEQQAMLILAVRLCDDKIATA